MLFLCLFLVVFYAVLGLQGDYPPQPPFNLQLANSSLWYASAAYCDTETYSTRMFKGPSAGFVYKGTIYDEKTDIQGI